MKLLVAEDEPKTGAYLHSPNCLRVCVLCCEEAALALRAPP